MSETGIDFREIFGRRPKVAIGHPMLGRGGSEGSLMWMIEALKLDCDVTVLTTKGWQLNELNEFYGTSVRPDQAKLRKIPTLLPDGVSAAGLRGAIFQRFLQKAAPEYDIRISAYNPADWGLPAMHKMADFSWSDEIKQKYDFPVPGFIYKDTLLRKAYLLGCRLIAGTSGRDCFMQDLVLANSHWVAEQLRQRCGGQLPRVEYPPVWCKFPRVAWDAKEFAFVMIGRISPEKRIESAIEALSAVRNRGRQFKLHLCGHIGGDPYGQMVRRLCDEHRDWIIPHGMVIGQRKLDILTNCRFGLHFGSREAFGIAVAEMVRAGAVVFAPRTGGQAEIIANGHLLFDSDSDAVEKIDAVLRSDALEVSLRRHLALKSAEFSAESFMAQFRLGIAEFCKASMSGGQA